MLKNKLRVLGTMKMPFFKHSYEFMGFAILLLLKSPSFLREGFRMGKTALILMLLAFSIEANTQIINFPDPNFKNALVNTKCVDTNEDYKGDLSADKNGDGEISVNEANSVKFLVLSNKKIDSLSGIENFTQLRYLNIDSNNFVNLKISDFPTLWNIKCESNSKLTSISLINLPLVGAALQRNILNKINLINLPYLNYLNCSNNKFKMLEISNHPNLIKIECEFNSLDSLIVFNLPKLEELNCSQNNLIKLDIENLPSLISLFCNSNQIKSIKLQNLPKLQSFSCLVNKLDSLNIDNLESLQSLFCSFNNIKHLKISDLKYVHTILCGNNQMNSIDIVNCRNLEWLECKNNSLTKLILNDFQKIAKLDCSNNPIDYLSIKLGKEIFSLNNLRFPSVIPFICTDEVNLFLFKSKFPNAEVNSYCTFTPGGKFYSIIGKNRLDINSNGCDESDFIYPNLRFQISNSLESGALISNSTGSYFIPLQAGTHIIKPILENTDHFIITPDSIIIKFPSTSDTIIQDFCITPKEILRQTNITVIPLTPPARPGLDAKYKIVWENVGNQIESGTLNFTYDEALLDYISATLSPDQIADGIVKWNFTNLLPFEKREIIVTLKVNRPTDSPPVNVGDKLYLSASILDNIFTLENTVVGSYDPNDKTCLQGDRVKPDMVSEYVDYLIRFENAGNYAAENVVVKDIIDTKRFDVSTLLITDASHEVYARIEGNKVEFIFENIQLPFDDANNDGYIAFKIKTLPTLVLGDSLKNLADIYFDYNFPIRTNEAKTTIASSVATVDLDNDIIIYPNPVRDFLHISTDIFWSRADIYDISDRILQSVALKTNSMDVGNLKSGTYIVLLRNGNKVDNVKFVKL